MSAVLVPPPSTFWVTWAEVPWSTELPRPPAPPLAADVENDLHMLLFSLLLPYIPGHGLSAQAAPVPMASSAPVVADTADNVLLKVMSPLKAETEVAGLTS